MIVLIVLLCVTLNCFSVASGIAYVPVAYSIAGETVVLITPRLSLRGQLLLLGS